MAAINAKKIKERMHRKAWPGIFPQRLGGQPMVVPWLVAAGWAAAASLKRRPSGAARMPVAPSLGRCSCAGRTMQHTHALIAT